MSETKEGNVKLRLSDASTNDFEMSSDDGQGNEMCWQGLIEPIDAIHLFLPIRKTTEESYEGLKERLLEVYCQLEQEINPVNIREERCIAATCVNLSSTVFSSKLYRRRSTLPLNS